VQDVAKLRRMLHELELHAVALHGGARWMRDEEVA
jgi:hypothetical protein